MTMQNRKKTTWNKVANWYGKEVGEKGHFYHQSVILPKIREIFEKYTPKRVLDLACGQGVLERILHKNTEYVGIDIAPALIGEARKLSQRGAKSLFYVADVSKPLKIKEREYDFATCVLALQNIENFRGVFDNIAEYLVQGGHFLVILNHPMFRIPRSSGWSIDPGNAKQVRWVSSYLREQKIPIVMNPGSERGKHSTTWSFHVPLATYAEEFTKRGFSIIGLYEWASPKESDGKFADRENVARQEIPLFMALLVRKDKE